MAVGVAVVVILLLFSPNIYAFATKGTVDLLAASGFTLEQVCPRTPHPNPPPCGCPPEVTGSALDVISSSRSPSAAAAAPVCTRPHGPPHPHADALPTCLPNPFCPPHRPPRERPTEQWSLGGEGMRDPAGHALRSFVARGSTAPIGRSAFGLTLDI